MNDTGVYFAEMFERFGFNKLALRLYKKSNDYYDFGRMCDELDLQGLKSRFFKSKTKHIESQHPEKILIAARIAVEMGLKDDAGKLYHMSFYKYTDPNFSKNEDDMYQNLIRAGFIAKEANFDDLERWVDTSIHNVMPQDE